MRRSDQHMSLDQASKDRLASDLEDLRAIGRRHRQELLNWEETIRRDTREGLAMFFLGLVGASAVVAFLLWIGV